MKFRGHVLDLDLTAEGEDLLDKVFRTFPRHAHLLSIGPGCTALRHIVEHQTGIAQDNHQNIVKFVRNPACHPPDRLQRSIVSRAGEIDESKGERPTARPHPRVVIDDCRGSTRRSAKG